MAEKLTVGELVYKISGDMENLQTELKKSETEIKRLSDAMEANKGASEKMNQALGKAGKVVKAFVGAFAIKEIIDFGRAAVQQAGELLEQQTKLAQVMRTSQNATDAEIQSLLEYADALEKTGVIDKEVILAAEAQLATYDLTTDSIKTLTPALLDYLAAEKGMNATKEDAIGLTNGLAQAIQGNYSSLSRTGFILDETTKELIENGTQAERVAAITDVLNSTYKDYNKTLAGTFLGTQKQVSREIGNFKEDLGFALMPTIQLLSGELLKLSGNFESGAPRVNAWGKTIYQATNWVITIGKAIVFVIQTLTAFGDMLFQTTKVVWAFQKNAVGAVTNVKDNFTSLGSALVKLFKGDFDGAVDALKDRVSDAFDDTGAAMDDFKNVATGWQQVLGESFDSVGQSALEAADATNFQPVTAAALTQWKAGKEAVDAFGEATDDTAESSEKLQDKLLGVLDTLKKTAQDLQGDVLEAFKKFNDEVGKTLEDTNNDLATTVLDAQDNIKKLKEELSNIDSTDSNAGEDRSRIRAEIKAQQEILDSRKGFEERQAEFVTGLREKLTAAGIDAEQEGLTSLLNIKSLEDKIKDERALRDLDDFAREEELQRRRLTMLVDNLIAEVTALREKITQQEALEQELTDFLINQNKLRKADVDAFANAAIAKYGEMARALKTAITMQQQLNNLRNNPKQQFAVGGYVGAKGGEVHPGEFVIPANLVQKYAGLVQGLDQERRGGSTTNNNNNVNAPISIQAQLGDRLDANALAKEIAWELGSR